MGRHYYKGSEAVIFVVDSNDRERIDDSGSNSNDDNVRDQLHSMLADEELNGAALLVFANKRDLPNAMSVDEITQRLQLNKLRNREWYIQSSCARSGDGLYEGLDWLSHTLKKMKKSVVKESILCFVWFHCVYPMFIVYFQLRF